MLKYLFLEKWDLDEMGSDQIKAHRWNCVAIK
jgi:hypothetical protein